MGLKSVLRLPTCTAADIGKSISLENRTYDYMIFLTGITMGKPLTLRHLVINHPVISTIKTINVKQPFTNFSIFFDKKHL